MMFDGHGGGAMCEEMRGPIMKNFGMGLPFLTYLTILLRSGNPPPPLRVILISAKKILKFKKSTFFTRMNYVYQLYRKGAYRGARPKGGVESYTTCGGWGYPKLKILNFPLLKTPEMI